MRYAMIIVKKHEINKHIDSAVVEIMFNITSTEIDMELFDIVPFLKDKIKKMFLFD